MYEPVLSLHASSPPLCGAAPFPRSASSVPSHAVSSARALAAAAVRRTEAQEDSASLHHVFTQMKKSCLSRDSHTNAETFICELILSFVFLYDFFFFTKFHILHNGSWPRCFYINNGRNCGTFTQDANIQTYALGLAQTHMHLLTRRATDTHLALSGGVMLVESSHGA